MSENKKLYDLIMLYVCKDQNYQLIVYFDKYLIVIIHSNIYIYSRDSFIYLYPYEHQIHIHISDRLTRNISYCCRIELIECLLRRTYDMLVDGFDLSRSNTNHVANFEYYDTLYPN